MQWARTGHTGRIVAVFFLLWTGVDLLNPTLCAIDREVESRSSQQSPAITLPASTQTAPTGGAEDCFCCCHHLVSTSVWAFGPHVDRLQRLVAPPVEQVRLFRTRLDHPPQLI